MKKLIFIIIFVTVCSVHAQTDDKETLKQINQNVVSSYQNQKIDEALKFAQQAVELSLKVYGMESLETAAAYSNLGVIYREKKKYKESVESLQKAADIYQKLPDLKNDKLVGAFEMLALSQFLDGDKTEAEANYLKALEITENKFGSESKESFQPTLNLAGFYARDKKFDKADEFYLKSYAIAVKNFGKQGEEIEQIENSRSCLVIMQNSKSENYKSYYEERTRRFGEFPEMMGVINGRAKVLPKPAYPSEAKSQRLGGSIPMRVRIDEQGNVTEVKAICGHPILAKASEEAVKKAKFEPASISGKPIKYSGIVFYNYIP